jgi:hypothetical protein
MTSTVTMKDLDQFSMILDQKANIT